MYLAMLWLTASTGSIQGHEMGTEFLAHMYNNYKSSFRSQFVLDDVKKSSILKNGIGI